MLSALIEALLGCRHRQISRVFWDADAAQMYVICLDCGRHFWYDWQTMCVITERDSRVRPAAPPLAARTEA
jgi:hypothetical protein